MIDDISKQYIKKENLYGLGYRKKTDNKKIKGVALLKWIASQISLCTACNSRKSTFLKRKSASKMLIPKTFW